MLLTYVVSKKFRMLEFLFYMYLFYMECIFLFKIKRLYGKYGVFMNGRGILYK